MALSELTEKPLPSIDEQAQLSRLGSGSSCRSFYSPWALWKDDKVSAIELPYKKLLHEVIVISNKEKQVSSSEAHRRVKSSSAFSTRIQRAEENLKVLLDALIASDWSSAYEVCWKEFHDMHHLFNSCEQPFTYMTDETVNVLNILQDQWQKKGDGPIITMDAGPNVHLLYRPDQKELQRQFKSDYLVGNYDVL